MHITSGIYKGKNLSVPRSGVSPTSEMLRQAVLSIIRPRLMGARMMDLCCGTGAVGLEALSNGAAWCLFVENAPKVYRILRQNLETIATGPGLWHSLQHNAAELSPQILGEDPGSYDIIFADPFYTDTLSLLERLHQLALEMLRPGGLFLLEHGQALPLESMAGFERSRRYGDSWLSSFTAPEPVL